MRDEDEGAAAPADGGDGGLDDRPIEGREGLVEDEKVRPLRQRTAIMCAEAVWWRCHRRIVADYLLARAETIFHIMGEGRVKPARLTPGALIRPDGMVVYPAES